MSSLSPLSKFVGSDAKVSVYGSQETNAKNGKTTQRGFGHLLSNIAKTGAIIGVAASIYGASVIPSAHSATLEPVHTRLASLELPVSNTKFVQVQNQLRDIHTIQNNLEKSMHDEINQSYKNQKIEQKPLSQFDKITDGVKEKYQSQISNLNSLESNIVKAYVSSSNTAQVNIIDLSDPSTTLQQLESIGIPANQAAETFQILQNSHISVGFNK